MHSFSEKQRFRLWWFWLLLLAIDLIPLYALYTQFYLGEPMGNKPMTDTQLVVFSSGMLLLNLLFFVMKLATKVDEKGISWSLYPLAKKSLTWDQIQTAEVKKIGFVGGFGIRLFTQYGTVYNVSGSKALCLTTQDGKKLAIGTQIPEQLARVIQHYKQS